ncbi:GAF domain-containing protein [Actinoplanes rectilineatus]|uniref:GAF domain-containing sensor histidine kinase n=1 Tax=Actinoplanes rectilineatus TaxID=113571 RepID=UPI0005F28081
MPEQIPPSLGLRPLSRIRLDELLHEMQNRVGDIVASRERLRALLDAVVGIGSDLDLRSTLERIVEAACALAGARYGALGVLAPANDSLSDFITYGIDPATHATIGDLPHGRGVLGLLITDPEPVRLPDITQHPDSFGFPAEHPPMHSFLGVPVRTHDQVFGNLYLAEKQGAKEFGDDDEEIVVALAAAAGVAIDNARLFELARRRQRWLEATAEITGVLLGTVRRAEALRLITTRVREMTGAELALILLYDAAAGRWTIEVADGADPDDAAMAGCHLPADAADAGRFSRERIRTITNLRTAAAWPGRVPDGPALAVPLTASDELQGVLIVSHPEGRPPSDEDVVQLSTFAGQAALALDRAQAQAEREQFAVLSDRERIARDLHDVVIQRLFATGLQLQGAAPQAGSPQTAARINAAIDELDATIRDIRQSIFALRAPLGSSLRADLRREAEAATVTLGFAPTVETSGPVDSAVPGELAADVLAVVREALANVARHARAGRVTVTVHADGRRVLLIIRDDGVGTDPGAARGGLVNLARRARDRNGSFEVRPAEEGPGTELVWSVPVPPGR